MSLMVAGHPKNSENPLMLFTYGFIERFDEYIFD